MTKLSKRQMTTLKDQAIQYALDCKWKEAIECNTSILAESPDDIDTLNRIGFAFMQTGDFDEAREIFEKVLALDESNPIAEKNIKKLATLSASGSKSNGSVRRVMTFIEEAGKTKTINLINVADRKTISGMQPGQEVSLRIKRSKIFIQTPENIYIGMLPDDLGGRLVAFLNEGNKYEAYLKAVEEKEVTVFIRECYRCKKLAQHPSFPNNPPAKRLKRRIIA